MGLCRFFPEAWRFFEVLDVKTGTGRSLNLILLLLLLFSFSNTRTWRFFDSGTNSGTQNRRVYVPQIPAQRPGEGFFTMAKPSWCFAIPLPPSLPNARPPARAAKEECRRIVSVASRASQCAFLHKQLTLLLLLPSATIAGCSSILSTPMQQQQHNTKKKKGGTHKEDQHQQQEKATSAITSKSYYYTTSPSTRPSNSSAAHYILTWPSHRLICCCCYGVPNLLLLFLLVISAPRFALYRSWLSKSWGVLLLLLSGDKNQSSSLLVDVYTDLCHTRSFSPSL